MAKQREIAKHLFLRALRQEYRRTLTGYVWIVLPMLTTTCIFSVLHTYNIVGIDNTQGTYFAFVLIGAFLWLEFAGSSSAPMEVLKQSQSIITKMNVPVEAVLMATIAKLIFHTIVRLLCLLAILMLLGALNASWLLLLVPVSIVATLMLGMGIGMLLLPLNTLYTDVQRLYSNFILRFWFFLTPVFYTPPDNKAGELILKLNPMSSMILETREWILFGAHAGQNYYVGICAVSVLLFALGWAVVCYSMPYILERLGS